MKNENYITLQGWMVNELKLSGNELIVYALIYGFSQDRESKFKGSMQYLADSLGITRRAMLPILKKLVEKKYIKKYETGKRGNKRCDYDVNFDILKNISSEETSPASGEETSHDKSEVVKKLPQSGEETSPASGEETSHHIYINKDIFINNNIPPKTAETKIAPVSRSPPNRKLELTEYQLALFNAAKACFDISPKSKALLYKDNRTAAMQMRILKEIVISCTNIEPDLTADFIKNLLEHFKVLCNGRLKNKGVEFTPRALITPWIWEIVISTLPEPDNELSAGIRESIRGMFK